MCDYSESHRLAVEKLFEVMEVKEKFEANVSSLLNIQMVSIPEMVKYRSTIESFLEKHVGWEALKSEVSEMYMKLFSEDELNALVDFYNSSLGEKVTKRMPAITAECMELGHRMIQENSAEFEQMLSEKFKETEGKDEEKTKEEE